MASARWPRRLASRSAASVSAVSPDCEMTSRTVFFSSGAIAVTEFVRELDLDRNLRQFFNQILTDERRVPARAAGGNDDAVNRAQFGGRHIQAAELGGGAFVVHAAAQGVFHRARLLENFLEHEVRVFSAHCVFLAEFQVADLDIRRVRAEIQNIEALRRDGGHVVVIEINHFFRVCGDKGIGVAGQEIFARRRCR